DLSRALLTCSPCEARADRHVVANAGPCRYSCCADAPCASHRGAPPEGPSMRPVAPRKALRRGAAALLVTALAGGMAMACRGAEPERQSPAGAPEPAPAAQGTG